MINQFWKIWQTEYLQYLREKPAVINIQNKNTIKTPTIEDVIIIHEKHTKRKTWKLSKIVSLLLSEVNVVTTAKVTMYMGNILVRPLKDLYYLELNKSVNTRHDRISPSSSNTSEEFDEIETIEMEEVDNNNNT